MPIVTKQNDLISCCSHARLAQFFSYTEIRPVLVRSGRFSTRVVTNEKQKKLNIPITRCYFKIDKSWIGYRSLTKQGFSANIDGLCNHFFHLFKMNGSDLKTYFVDMMHL